MNCVLILDIVIREGSAIVQLLASVDEPKITCWEAIFVVDCFGKFENGSTCVSCNCYRFASQCLDENLDILGYNLGSVGTTDIVVIPEAYIHWSITGL
jgi:hypothetical protein